MKNIGLYAQWDDKELKMEVNKYYDLVDFRFGEKGDFVKNVTPWQESLIEKGISNSNPYIYEDPIKMLENNRKMSGQLRNLIRDAAWLIEAAPLITKSAEQIISLIDAKLGN